MTFLPQNTQIHKILRLTKGHERDFTNNIGSLKFTYMCMICRVCVLRTNRKHLLHLSEGGTDKHLKKILRKFSRYCRYIISECVISTVCLSVCLSVVACCHNKLNSDVCSERKSKIRKCTYRLAERTLKFKCIKEFIIQRPIMRRVNLLVVQRMCR
jgi:hypothetical protein